MNTLRETRGKHPPEWFVDHCSKDGAEKLAKDIRRYWRRRGYDVETWIEQGRFKVPMRTAQWYAVRSNLVNGMPPRGSKISGR